MINVTGVATYVGRSRRPIQTFTVVTGVAELDRMFTELSRGGQNAAVRTAMAKMLRVINSAIRNAVPNPLHAGHRKQSAQQAINWRFKRNPFANKVEAKVGGGVGKQLGAQANRKGKRRGGVGISANNIHWWLLGTKQRFTGQIVRKRFRKRKFAGFSVKFTGNKRMNRGVMPAFGVVRQGYGQSAAQADQVFLTSFREALQREIDKSRLKAGGA
mgnify:CR=1 FL=1